MTNPQPTQPAADRPVLAILLMMLAVGTWALHDAIAKVLAATYAVPQVLFVRSCVAFTLVACVLAFQHGLAPLRTAHLGLNIVRGLMGCAAIGLFFMALPLQPLVSTFAICTRSLITSDRARSVSGNLQGILREPRCLGPIFVQ